MPSLTIASCSPSTSLAAKLAELLLFAGSAFAFVALTKKQKHQQNCLTKALQDGTSLNAKELVFTVTEENEPIPGGSLRCEMRLNKLWHRATYVVVLHKDPAGATDGDTTEGGQEPYILVQRRSLLKDYFPGKIDPTPGGVVVIGESCLHNATRELQEEMGIDVSSPDSPNNLMRLFTFPFQDENVKVWGELYEATFVGNINDLVLQPEEVDSVIRMPLSDLERDIRKDPTAFIPDSIHALKLYFQHKEDKTLKRKLLKGYSSGNIDEYRLRPKPKVVFFDCDDCLYFDGWRVANMLTKKIEDWCQAKGLKEGEAYQLYKKYGTALKGLLEEGYLEHTDEAIDGYLRDVHDIPVGKHLQKDPELRDMILRIDPSVQRYIFTASVRHHAERCLKALGIDDLFAGIIDVKDCELETKHSRKSFEIAMRIAGVEDPEACLFLDDSLKNIHTGREIGWRSILVGKVGRDCGSTITSEHAEHEIDRIHEFPSILPELFVEL